MNRASLNRLLWGAVKRVREGEAALRDRVVLMNDRDGTNAAARGTDDYSSTRLLSDAQLAELADHFRRAAHLPPPSRQAAGPRGGRPRRPTPTTDPANVAHLASEGERAYVAELFRLLDWKDTERDAFISRQTRGIGLTTHSACTAVIAPLERMARGRGIAITEQRRIKTISTGGAR